MKTKSSRFPKRLGAYGIAASAVLLVGTSANGALRQTQCTGDYCTLDTLLEQKAIDINADGKTDFTVFMGELEKSYSDVLIRKGQSGAGIVRLLTYCNWQYGKAARYDPGGTGASTSANIGTIATLHSTYGSCGNFHNASGVIAVKFNINGSLHYGWINYTGHGDNTGTIVSWGYETTPNTTVSNYPSDPTLVELISFTATPGPQLIRLAWETASEIDNAGFHVWRSENKDWGYQRITDSLIPAQGGPTQGAAYAFEDKTPTPGKTWFYKLEDIDEEGNSTYHQVVSAWPGVVNLCVNGSDGPAAVPASDPVSVKVSVQPEEGAAAPQEWWLCCESPFGWFSYINPKGWVPGIEPAWVNPQVPIDNLQVLNGPLPKGDYTFHFALDSRVDGRPPAPLTQQAQPLDRLFLNTIGTTPAAFQQLPRWQRAVPNWHDSVEIRVE